jgi:hypothetical protein
MPTARGIRLQRVSRAFRQLPDLNAATFVMSSNGEDFANKLADRHKRVNRRTHLDGFIKIV